MTMKKLFSRGLLAAVTTFLASLGASELQAQTTFTACRVPDVGAIYMIGVSGAPSACLDETHIEFSWTEGSGSLTEGSVTTTEILDGTIASVDIGADAVTSAEIADGTVANVDLAPGVASVIRNVITYSTGVEDTSISSTREQLRVIGSFTKNFANTDVQVVWNSHVAASGGSCSFHIRVDGAASPSSDLGATTSGGDYDPVSTTNVFPGLGTGTHQITVWVRGVGATSCFENPGNFSHHVVVTEYNPG